MKEEKIQDKLRRKWRERNAFFNQPNQKVYRLQAVHYLLIHQFEQWLIHHHSFTAMSKIICVGCHHGRLLSEIDQNMVIKGYYVDQSPALMQTAIHLYPHFSYKFLQPQVIPYKNKKFHYAIVAVPFHTLFHQSEIVAELKRVLKKNGMIYLYDRNRLSPAEVIESNGLYIAGRHHLKFITIYELKALEDKKFV
ncbi:class I SAM-dependent methyltransferase [Macrococcus lamae]|uniref:Class I SAM-dependent methyltransferase n=1 Tax=Macrococcus lamae TaxID=198484 RepID=A0A4V3BEV2_9STAP|nr:methyltransferase domain-containing protein [Macrococcus lamae]TDM07360.1 class I SAM-dependent methyltransferase [Macrococcus lamae]